MSTHNTFPSDSASQPFPETLPQRIPLPGKNPHSHSERTGTGERLCVVWAGGQPLRSEAEWLAAEAHQRAIAGNGRPRAKRLPLRRVPSVHVLSGAGR